MSLGEAQQIYEILMRVDELLKDIEAKIVSIHQKEPSTQRTLAAFRDLERVTLRYLFLARQLGLPEDVDGQITKIMRLITVARMAHISISLMMASNPVTVAIGIAGLATAAISMSDSMAGY